MTTELKITKTEGNITVLHFDGHLDGQTENLAIESTRAVMNAGARFLLIDLSNVHMITSSGLRALHVIFKMFTPPEEMEAWKTEHPNESFKSPYFKLCGASTETQYVLNVTGFLESISIYATLQEALDSFSS